MPWFWFKSIHQVILSTIFVTCCCIYDDEGRPCTELVQYWGWRPEEVITDTGGWAWLVTEPSLILLQCYQLSSVNRHHASYTNKPMSDIPIAEQPLHCIVYCVWYPSIPAPWLGHGYLIDQVWIQLLQVYSICHFISHSSPTLCLSWYNLLKINGEINRIIAS